MKLVAAMLAACLLAGCRGRWQAEPKCTDPACACLPAGCPPEQECYDGVCAFPCRSHLACTFSRDIAAGYCGKAGCTSLRDCRLEGCAAHEVCQWARDCRGRCQLDFLCEAPATTCTREGVTPCMCHIVNSSGTVDVEGATIFLTPQQRWPPSILLVGADRLVAGGDFDLDLDVTSVQPTQVTVTASLRGAGPEISCAAQLVIAGSPGADIEVVVTDAATGAPLPGALAVIDGDADGVDDAGAGITDGAGLTSAAWTSPSAIDVTVFSGLHAPSSVLGLQAPAAARLAVAPWPARVPVARMSVAGSSVHYEARTALGAIGAYVAATSVLLLDLVSWADDLIVGELRARPGAAVEWTLGLPYGMVDLFEDFGSAWCPCDGGTTCDNDCECDADCAEVPDSGSVAARLWGGESSIALSSGVGRGVVLDSSTDKVQGGRVIPQRPLEELSELPVPDFPLDPARAGGEILQQLIVMSGSNVPGAGFVPLGFGVGLACKIDPYATADNQPICPTGAATDPRVKSGFHCIVEDPLRDACPSYIPSKPDPGRVILQYTPPHDGLEGWPEVMVAIALPDKSRMYADDHRVAGLIVHRAPVRDYDDAFAGAAYPSFPLLPATYVPRTYELHAEPSFDIHWVLLGDEPDDPTVPRWEIFAPADVDRTFIAPVPPPGIDDLFDGTRVIKIRHTGLRLLPGETLQSLAASGALAPGKLFDHVSAFATRRGVLQP